MRTGSVFVAILVFLTTVCAPQTALVDFEGEHDLALKQNPPGLQATLVVVGGRTAFRMSDQIELTLSISAQRTGVYSLTRTGSYDEELVLQPPYPLHSMKIGLLAGCVNNCAQPRPITSTAIGVSHITTIGKVARNHFIADVLKPGGGFGLAPLPPGEYALYLQTKRVRESIPAMNGQRAIERQLLVTSDNVLHVTLLPSVDAQPPAAPRKP